MIKKIKTFWKFLLDNKDSFILALLILTFLTLSYILFFIVKLTMWIFF